MQKSKLGLLDQLRLQILLNAIQHILLEDIMHLDRFHQHFRKHLQHQKIIVI